MTRTINQMFFDVAEAIDIAQVQLAEIANADVVELDGVLVALYKTTDQLLAQLAALPPTEIERFYAPLQHVLKHLEHFEHTMRAARNDIRNELNLLQKHRRAFTAYLSTPSGKV